MDASRYRPEIQADLEQDPAYQEWRRVQSEPPQTSNPPLVVSEESATYIVNEIPGTTIPPQFTDISGRARSLANLRPYQPGQIANPGGRPTGAAGFSRLIQHATRNGELLVEIALEIAQSKRSADKDRLRAIEFLATRAFGAPLQLIKVLDEAEIERRAREAGVDPELVKQHLRSQQK